MNKDPASRGIFCFWNGKFIPGTPEPVLFEASLFLSSPLHYSRKSNSIAVH